MWSLAALCALLLALLGVLGWVAFRPTHAISLADTAEIPRLLHQTWKNEFLPPRYRTCQESWKRMNPDLEYRFHDDAACEDLVRRHYPQYLGTYLDMDQPVQRADMFRYMAVHHHGGIYADMDTTCLKPLSPLFAAKDRVVAAIEMHTPNYQILQWCFAARPGQPVFLRILDEIVVRHRFMQGKPLRPQDRDHLVLWETGPALFTEYLLKENKRSPGAVTIHPRCTFGAYDLSSACLKQAYLVHHFDGSWKTQWDPKYKLW
jgi:mannosyltransferase OCH1-like enzyme